MKINDQHLIEGIKRDMLPGGSEMPIRRFLVIHFTSGASGQSSINFWKTPEAKGASAHLVIERDGAVIQCRPFNRTCGHAGKSRWRGFDGLNACSIGIELANAGDDSRIGRKWSKLPPVQARHKNETTTKEWEAYPEEQVQACIDVSKLLAARYKLDDVIGHEDIAPNRKNDPGPAFPMGRLRLACGFPEAIKP